MNTTVRPAVALQSPLSIALRVATAIAVAGVTVILWAGAEHASHTAVQSAAQAISSSPTHVTLQAVQVVARRV